MTRLLLRGARAAIYVTASIASLSTARVCRADGAAQTAGAAAMVLPSISLSTDKLSFASGTTAQPTSAGSGITVRFTKADWPGVRFDVGKAYDSADWSHAGGLAIDIRNPGKDPLPVFFRMDDSPLADGTHHCRSGVETLQTGEEATLIVPMAVSAPGMRGGPPLAPGSANPKVLTVYGDPLNETNILAFQVFLNHPAEPRDLEIRSVRLLPRPDLVGIVDRWGQYAKAAWPGKVTSDADLKSRVADEQKWLDANPPPTDRDEYGGWKSGPALKATGFFRTAVVVNGLEVVAPKPGEALPAGGRWWLVTPGGHLFWSAGVDVVRPYAEGPVKGRESMFLDLPDEAKKTGQADFYWNNLGLKYGWETRLPSWGMNVSARLRSCGFNTIGNWSDVTLFHVHPVPYTVPLYVSGLPPIGPNPTGGGFALPDYFDARFPTLARGSFADQTKNWKDDPWCLGYFVDNELPWDTWAQMGTGGEYVVARNALAAKATQPARQAFIALLKKEYATPADWAKAWTMSAVPADWDSPVTLKASDLNAAAKADCAAFSTALAERYFSVVHDALKAAAPNQLYLGCRFAIRPWEMVNVAARYCDVMSFNIYEDAVTPKEWGFTNKLGKPVVIGEYHFGAIDRGLFHPGLRSRKNQAERASAYEAYVKSARAMPAFVGCHWFQWIDEPVTGRFDGENYNVGFVTVTDTMYPEMRDAARRVNSSLYGTP